MSADRAWDVVVSVGTDHHEFTRVIEWTESWAVSRGMTDRCFIQYGYSPAPNAVEGRAFLTHEELQACFADPLVIVTHGGPGTILGARAAGLRPVVVPRRAAFGEHVDDHQWRFARRMAESNLVTLADDEEGFVEALDLILDDPRRGAIVADDDARVADTVDRFAQIADALITRGSSTAVKSRGRSGAQP